MADIKRKVPNLRFKGFTDDWEQRKLGDEYKHIGNAFVGTASPYYTQNGYFYLESNNIKNGQINHDHEVFINESFYHKQLNKLLHTGDLVMVQSGHVGDTAVITEKYNGTAAHALIMFRKPQNNMLSFFLNSFFQSSNAKNRIDVLAIGNTIRHILASDMKKFVVYLPDNKEKVEVVELFLELQKLISLQQRKLELLKQLKKGFLQKMFAEKNNKQPVLRFKGFHDDWEQRKLGDVAQIETGKLDANAMVEGGKYDFYTSGIKKYHIDIPAFEGPAITIAGNGATVGYMHLADGMFNAYQRTYVLTKFIATDRKFLFNEIGNNLPRKIQQESRAGNIPYIVMDMLTGLKISLPSFAEQEKIGKYFADLDSLIALHQRKQNHLKLLKKSLLQQMFM
ncbi:hypothetical protein B5F04_00015 [Limosilactobacillus reuteri]|nr:hypothetical protein B5F04_00015 [Limosilactobacillus reuteri]